MQRESLRDDAYEEKKKRGGRGKRRDGGKKGGKGKKIKVKKKAFLPFGSETELLPQDLISNADFKALTLGTNAGHSDTRLYQNNTCGKGH